MLPASEVSLSRNQLEKILKALLDVGTSLTASKNQLAAVGPQAFGGSWMGSFVQGHTQKAYDAIDEALADNATAMAHYEEALRLADANQTQADESSAAATAATTQRVADQTTQVDLGNGCVAAGAGDTTATCEA